MSKITKYLENLDTGAAQTYKNMTILPLMGKNSALDYIVFDEALKSGLTVKETGSVPKLYLSNMAGKEILVMQGEYVVGGYQNRMMAQNMYLAKDFSGDVPVNCVQAGRWTTNIQRDFKGEGGRVSPKIYTAAYQNQGEVWDRVRGLSMTLNTFSNTNDYTEVNHKMGFKIDDYESKFSYVPGSVGMIIAIQNNGVEEYVLDVFDSSKTLEKNFRKLVKASAIEASASGNQTNNINANKILESILINAKGASFERRVPISLGKDYKINGKEIEGSAIVLVDTPVYININKKFQGKNNGWNIRQDQNRESGFNRFRYIGGPGSRPDDMYTLRLPRDGDI